MNEPFQPNQALCPVCEQRLTTGQLICDAEIPFGGMVRSVPVHEHCGRAMEHDQGVILRTMERLEHDFELAARVLQFKVTHRP